MGRAILRAVLLVAVVGAFALAAAIQSGADTRHPYEASIDRAAPVAYWPLDETRGRVARDAVGDLPGAYIGQVALGVQGATSDRSTSSAALDGLRGAIFIGGVLPFGGESAFTLEAWVRPRAQQARFARIVSSELFDPVSGRQGYALYTDRDRLGIERLRDGLGQGLIVRRPLPRNRFSHLVASFDGNRFRLFVDGEQVGQRRFREPVLLDNGPRALLLGGLVDRTDASFSGTLDNVAIYARAVPPSEIRSRYDAARG